MRPILLIMWTAFQSFIQRDNNNNNKSIKFHFILVCDELMIPI